MKTKNLLIAFVITSFAISFTSCKKNDKENTTPSDPTTEVQVQSDDQARFSNENDAIDNEANAALDNYGGIYNERPANNGINQQRPVGGLLPLPCDATITTDFQSSPHTITITYNGSNCNNTRTRTGKVVLSFAPDFRWKNAGAVLTVDAQNLKITRKRDGKSITINGTKTITNVSGGLLKNLASLGTITHEIKSAGAGVTVTFDDNTQRKWNFARRRVFTYDAGVNGGIVITITGIGDPVGSGNAEWGTNRFNRTFTTSITQPLVIKQSCDFRLVSGQITHVVPIATTTVTYGLDVTGIPVTICPSGSFYYKIEWARTGGNTYTYIGPY